MGKIGRKFSNLLVPGIPHKSDLMHKNISSNLKNNPNANFPLRPRILNYQSLKFRAKISHPHTLRTSTVHISWTKCKFWFYTVLNTQDHMKISTFGMRWSTVNLQRKLLQIYNNRAILKIWQSKKISIKR